VTEPTACSAFSGGNNISYWRSHTGIGGDVRDRTYDKLPIFLGVLPEGPVEQYVHSEADAITVFDQGATLSILALKAQLLAAKLNSIKFAGFTKALLANGATVEDAIAQSDQVLDDVGSGAGLDSTEINKLIRLLNSANNNGATTALYVAEPGCFVPTPASDPAVAGENIGPDIQGRSFSRLPATGGSPALSASGIWAIIVALSLLTLGALTLHSARKKRG
jgi:hypothetical protein